MSNREGISRGRPRPTAPIPDQVLTPLGRGPATLTSIPISLNQISGNVRLRPSNIITNPELDSNLRIESGLIDMNYLTPITTFDAEQFRSEIKANHDDIKRIEQLILNAISYFHTTSKRSSQQLIDYTVLTFLAWTVSLHSSIFRSPAILKAMCVLFKGLTATKTIKTLPINNTNNTNNNTNNNVVSSTPYTLLCQIFWLAYKDQKIWPDEFIELYVDDALGDQNWIKNPDCHLFVANIRTAFHTRPSTWKLERSKILSNLPSTTTTTTTLSTPLNLTDDTSNDSNMNSESLGPMESESSIQIIDESVFSNSDHQLIYPRYEHLSLYAFLLANTKLKSIIGNTTNLNATTPNSTTSNTTSQGHETEKLLYLLEQLCGLPEIRSYILSKLEVWLQNPKLTGTSGKLMLTLCENLTKSPSNSSLTNGHEKSYIDERSIEQLINLRFKVRASNDTVRMHMSCIREMLRNDINLVDTVVRLIVQNELQQNVSSTSPKNPNNTSLLHTCCQAQQEATCQSLALSIQNILLSMTVTTTSKDYDNLLKSIRPFIRELMKFAKNDFDPIQFSMYLIDMHYSKNLQSQFWTMIQQTELPSSEITSERLLKNLLKCDISTRERFLCAICDLIPMIILASAQIFQSSVNPQNSTTYTKQWLVFIERVALIQCSSCLFFLYTLPRLFDSTITISYVPCLYSILFTAVVNSYLRIENWPPEEPFGLRNELFRLSSDIPVLGETLYLLVQIGLTPHFRISSSIIIDLIDIIIRRTLSIEQKMPSDYNSNYLHLPDKQCELFFKKIFDLTRYHYPTQIQFPPDYQIPQNLSITEIFWKTCLICLLLACRIPKTFGRYTWTSIPQIRLFLEMLLTGDYTYPPRSMIENKQSLEKLYHDERIQLREEKDLLLEFEQYLAQPKIIDETNSQLLGKVLVLDLQQIKRPISHDKNEKHFYNLIQGLNNNYKLSSMLCRCREPDFILDVLNRQEQQSKTYFDNQTSWLTSLVDSNIDCLHVFPIVCLCDYFQHMILIFKRKTFDLTKRTYQALETILSRFKTIFRHVQQEIHKQILQSNQIDDFISILTYFFNCLNSNISNIRSNAWLCLTIIFDNQSQSEQIEDLLNRTNINMELILSTISKFQSIEKTHRLIQQTFIDTCQYETNISFLHSTINFILNHCQIDSNEDEEFLGNLSRILIRRQTIFYLLIQYDRKDKSYQLITKYFQLILSIILRKLVYALVNPIEINSDTSTATTTTTTTEINQNNIQTYLILTNLNAEQKKLIENLAKQIHFNEQISWKTKLDRQYLPIDRILIEILIIFLAYFDNPAMHVLGNLLQEFLLEKHGSLAFQTLKQLNRPQPIRQTSDETKHFEQFSIDEKDVEDKNSKRKRRLSEKPNQTEKIFLSSTNQCSYEIISMDNNQTEQSIFHSDHLQYFLLKSNHFLLVRQCIDQATMATCLKMFKYSIDSKQIIDYLCKRLNHLIGSSSKSLQPYLKQPTLILPLINRWIIEKLPEAIQLGEKLKKILEKKKKYPNLHHDLIPTTFRSTISICDQMQTFDQQITQMNSKANASNDNQMDVNEVNFNLPWKTSSECDEFLRFILDNKSDRIQRHQYLLQLQWLMHQSNDYRSQILARQQTIQSSNIFKFFLRKDLSNQLSTTNTKFIELTCKELIDRPSLLNRVEREKDFYRLTNQNTDQIKQCLIEILVRHEHQLSESSIGMILDRLALFDSQTSIYSNLLLFSQRTHTSISQRLLLKQFLHSCPWPIILTSISNLLNIENSSIPSSITVSSSSTDRFLVARNSHIYSNNFFSTHFDSTLVLDMFEAFIKLSPLWSSRESKMFNRCHDEFLIDFDCKQIRTLIFFILDEGEQTANETQRFQQYQKRYDNLLSFIIQNPKQKALFPDILQKIYLDYRSNSIVQSFYFILYLNQIDLFADDFYLNLTKFFTQTTHKCFHLSTNIDPILHDLFNRLNSYDVIQQENYQEIQFLLKQYICKSPLIILRYLPMIKINLQARFSTMNFDEYQQKNSKIRQFFLGTFDLIYRLKPFIYDEFYHEDFQSILEIYIRLIHFHSNLFSGANQQNLSSLNIFQNYIYLIDNILMLIYEYFLSRQSHLHDSSLLKRIPNRFFEKLQEKMQTNKDINEYLSKNRNYKILFYLKQLKILFDSIQIDCQTDVFDIHLNRLNSSMNIDEIYSILNEFKLPIEHSETIFDQLTKFLLSGNKQLIDQTYDILLKYLNKYPQHASRFYSIYNQCLLSTNSIVFQLAIEHFPRFTIFFQSKSQDLFSLILKQGLINKIDVTSPITQAIRLLNLHRYDPITYTNSSNTLN